MVPLKFHLVADDNQISLSSSIREDFQVAHMEQGESSKGARGSKGEE